MVFPVVMYGCESWTIKKAECQRIDAFELWCWRRLLSSLNCREIQPVHPEGNQSWIFIGRTDAKAETPILWPPDAKSWFIWKDWRREEKGTTEEEMAGWHHRLNGHESESTLGVGDGQGGVVCCSPWGRKESDTTGPLTWTELHFPYVDFVYCWSKLIGIWQRQWRCIFMSAFKSTKKCHCLPLEITQPITNQNNPSLKEIPL